MKILEWSNQTLDLNVIEMLWCETLNKPFQLKFSYEEQLQIPPLLVNIWSALAET